jgi:hypothetical protein
VSRHPIRRVAALAVSLSLAFAVIVPLHTHTCHWPSAASGAAAFEPLPDADGTATEHEATCLACTIERRLRAPVTVGPVASCALPARAHVAPTPLPGRPACDALRLTPPRGPPLSS